MELFLIKRLSKVGSQQEMDIWINGQNELEENLDNDESEFSYINALYAANRFGSSELFLEVLKSTPIGIIGRYSAGAIDDLYIKFIIFAKDKISNYFLEKALIRSAKFDSIEFVPQFWELCKERFTNEDVTSVLKIVAQYGKNNAMKAYINVMSDRISDNTYIEIINSALAYAKLDTLKEVLEIKGWMEASIYNVIESVNIELIKILEMKKYLPKDFVFKTIKEHTAKGNFDLAEKFLTVFPQYRDIATDDAIDIFVDAIRIGLDQSAEPNKYQAITQLLNKAGIHLSKFYHKLLEVKDNNEESNFQFINGLAHKLAKYYLSLQESTSSYKKLANAIINLDNDFALEVLTINALLPERFEEDTIVYRGMRIDRLDNDYSEHIFEYGTRAFAVGVFQKILGYSVYTYWNQPSDNIWDFSCTYVSTSASVASRFANFISIDNKERKIGVLFEVKLPKNSPKICGSWEKEYELMPSYIQGDNIIAIYNLNFIDGLPKVTEVYYNSNSKSIPMYAVGDVIMQDDAQISVFENICGGQRNKVLMNEIIYKSEEDFYSKYTKEDYARDQEKLWENYFDDRVLFKEDFFIKQCNPDIYCC